jgi:ATP-dependent DNA helicase DinG
MKSIIAIDIETTGLDPNRDAITEIGAIRFNGNRIEEEWSTLINPRRHIPENITQLTGIDDSMVRNAPTVQEVVRDLENFVGTLPVMGHNVRFDLSFLQKQGLFAFNPIIDTYELASVLLPTASRYNLGALAQLLAIPLPATHRALDDARVTQAVFLELYELARQLPIDTLAEITRLCEPIEWDGAWVFMDVMRERSHEPIDVKKPRRRRARGEARYDTPPLSPVETPVPLDPDEVAALLEYGGPFSNYFQSYEQRPEQVEMLRAISNALSYSQHLMVEAGTGVGKSFAYLVPAALFAMQNNTRVVVSTNTINLQDQLMEKDIPAVGAALGIDLRGAMLKGRSNYLCPRRLELLRKMSPRDAEEMRVLAKVMVWQLFNENGDRNELTLNRPVEKEIWRRLSAEDDACTTENCLRMGEDACPFQRAKAAAQAAHVLVVNHALLLSDVATGSRVLPEYQYLIVDEAHHLEAATTNALSFRLTQTDLDRMLKELGGTGSGVLGGILLGARDAVRPSDFALLDQKVRRATDLAFRMQQYVQDFFYAVGEFVKMAREGQGASYYAYQLRILPQTRLMEGWENVEMDWQSAGETFNLLTKVLSEIQQAAADLYGDGVEGLEEPLGSLGNVYRRLSEAEVRVGEMIHEPDNSLVYWVEVQPNGRLSLNAAPLRVGPLIQKHLWHEKSSVILTSATMTANGDFTYARTNLMAEEADVLSLGSPFDYESSTLLYVPGDIPEPNAPGFQPALDRAIIQLANAIGGRTLVLFTSYAQLKRTAQAITAPLAENDIWVFEQGDGASPNALLDAFKSAERAVLLGTRSFWEGVDLPGEQLSAVVITKLPFDVPSDPLIAARSETYEDPFGEYQLPEAILRFRQGFGRLIRTASDRGVVAILDKRVLTKQYGRYFMNSLPTCTLNQGSLNNLAREAARWLNL